MKLFIFSILTLTIFTGCVKEELLVPKKYENLIVDKQIYQKFHILNSVYKTKNDGLIVAEVNVKNISSSEESFTYKVDWKDIDGFDIQTIMSRWITVNVEPKRRAIISVVAPSAKAKQYIIHITTTSSFDEKRKNSYQYEYQN